MSKNPKPASFKSGYIAILGRPNVGKSTLLNALVGEKLAGISPKPQTTRNQIRGIHTEPRGQMIFLDTPGLHDPRDPLGQFMVEEVQRSLEGADLLCWMVLPEPPVPFEEKILKLVKSASMPALLLINQTDLFAKEAILPVIDHYQKAHSFCEIIPISAKTGDQLPLLKTKLFEHLPEGPAYFPEDQISDHDERFRTTEIIREKLFRATSQEIPYATAVEIESYDESDPKIIRIRATIAVERDSQKKIIIGAGGQMIKSVGTEARKELEHLLNNKVFLELWVKVIPDWKTNPQALRRLGYRS